MSVCPSVYRVPLTDFREIWHLGTDMKICRENKNLVKIGQIIGHFTRSPKCVLLCPATLNRHTNAAFKGKGIRLLAYPWRYKHYANATQVMRTMPILLYLHIPESVMVYVFYYAGNNEISVFTALGLNCRATTCSWATRSVAGSSPLCFLLSCLDLWKPWCVCGNDLPFFRLLTLIYESAAVNYGLSWQLRVQSGDVRITASPLIVFIRCNILTLPHFKCL